MVPEFQKHPGNNTIQAAVSFSGTRNHKGQNWESMEAGGTQPCFSGQKLLH
jgi:hypothetical protein